MTLGELLDRAYEILGDLRAAPRIYPRQMLLDIVNRGTLLFRATAAEVWRRQDIPTVGGTGEYEIPPTILELRRVAYDDETLEARSLQVIQSRDAKWQTTTGPEPIAWTSVGFAQNRFFVWPKPSTSTPETFTLSASYGGLSRWVSGGTAYTFSSEFGGPSRIDGEVLDSEYGDIISSATSEGQLLTVWGTARPDALSTDDQELPLRRPWQIALLWFLLWQIYESEGREHNSVLAAFYRDEFSDVLERCTVRAATPVPGQPQRLRGGMAHEPLPEEEARYGDGVFGGVPTPILWPRDNF